jgi:signal transduction histidine kinase
MPVRITDGSAGRAVAFLYVGSMIGPVLEPADRAFLRSVNRSVFLTTVLVVMLAAGLGTILVINITSPIWSLHAASKRIGQGDLSARAGKDGSSRMKSGATAAGKRNSSRGSQRRDELGELTEQFNSMADSLEKAAESRKRIIADTAHELRTPVSLIQGKLEMILEGIYSPDRDTLSALYEETKLLAGLIEELQQLADADAGSLFLKKGPVSLSSLMEHAAEMFAPEMKKKGIIFSFPSPQSGEPFEEFPVRADPRKITQVIANLLSNAVRHTPEGGSVEAVLDQSSGEVRLSVANSGPPIPEDKLESVFDRFYRLDEGRSRKEGGAGLGLAICKVIVEAHGGRIWAENIRSFGVRFTFSLPRSVQGDGFFLHRCGLSLDPSSFLLLRRTCAAGILNKTEEPYYEMGTPGPK